MYLTDVKDIPEFIIYPEKFVFFFWWVFFN